MFSPRLEKKTYKPSTFKAPPIHLVSPRNNLDIVQMDRLEIRSAMTAKSRTSSVLNKGIMPRNSRSILLSPSHSTKHLRSLSQRGSVLDAFNPNGSNKSFGLNS